MPNKTPTPEELKTLSQKLPETIPYLKMLVLFGSRATGEIHANSDWDFATLYDEGIRKRSCQGKPFSWFEVPQLLSDAFNLNSDKIDVVDLNRCPPLLGFQVARDGKLLYEQQSGRFLDFQCQAWKVYADTAKFRKAQKESIELWLQKRGI